MPALFGDVDKRLPGPWSSCEAEKHWRHVSFLEAELDPSKHRVCLSPPFLAQNGAFFCRKEAEFQYGSAGRAGQARPGRV